MNDAGEDKEVNRVDPRLEKKFRLINIVSTARDAIRWVLIQMFKVLRIIKAAVQALFETFLPEKFIERTEFAIRSARERLVTAAFRSSIATWAVLSCTINMINAPTISLCRSLKRSLEKNSIANGMLVGTRDQSK